MYRSANSRHREINHDKESIPASDTMDLTTGDRRQGHRRFVPRPAD
jgi:hypothetical protein